jgi:MFS family permease
MLREFGVAPSAAGLLPAAFIVGAAAAQLPASYLGARYGHDRVAGIGMAIFGASSVLMSAAPRWEWALGFRALGGVGALLHSRRRLSRPAVHRLLAGDLRWEFLGS